MHALAARGRFSFLPLTALLIKFRLRDDATRRDMAVYHTRLPGQHEVKLYWPIYLMYTTRR